MNNWNTPCRTPYTNTGNGTNECHERNHSNDTSCACRKSRLPASTAYAIAYVPFQQSGEVYDCDKALARGTIFPCLDLPFLKGCCK